MTALRRMLAAGAALIVLLTMFGPLLDHHFAERQPGHLHIYLGEAALDHVHPYEAPHVHDQTARASTSGDLAASAGEILFLSPDEGGFLGAYALALVAVASWALLLLVLPPVLGLLFPRGRETLRAFTPLLDPPPPRPAL